LVHRSPLRNDSKAGGLYQFLQGFCLIADFRKKSFDRMRGIPGKFSRKDMEAGKGWRLFGKFFHCVVIRLTLRPSSLCEKQKAGAQECAGAKKRFRRRL
jgi:hypothetical protein